MARRLPLRCGLLLAFRLAAEHLHFVGANLSAVLLLAVLVGPFPRAQRTLDIDLTALAQKPFDLPAALEWVKKAATVEQVKQRGRQAYAKATNEEDRARIAALVEELKQAALAAA